MSLSEVHPSMKSRTTHICPYYSLLLILLLVLQGCNKESAAGPEQETEYPPIPYLSIDTGGATIQNEPKIPSDMYISIGDLGSRLQHIGIEYRGSTSLRLFPKKSYGIETWDESGKDMDISMLGLPEEEDWILYGPYSDKTLIRNLILYELANEFGQYAPKTKIVELEVNEEYQGAYIFMEKIKRDDNRLDMSDLDPDENDAATISGGYILKIDKTAGDTADPDWSGDATYSEFLGFRSVYGVDQDSLEYPPFEYKRGEETYFLYEDPEAEDITPQQKQYIQNYVNAFEQALIEDDFTGGQRTYTDYIDLDSFVDFFILNELSANPDAYRLSTYLHKDRDGLLKMGPVWDFNLAFGNDGRSTANQWIFRYNERVPDDLWLVPFWWERLFSDPLFRIALKSRWQELRSGILSTSTLTNKIDNKVNHITESGLDERNFDRWPILGEPVPFNSHVSESYEDEITYLKDWLLMRLSWMDEQIGDL